MDADRLPFPRLLHLLPQWSRWPRCPPLPYLHLSQPLLPQATSQQKPFHRLLVHTASLAREVYKVNKNILGIISPLFPLLLFLIKSNCWKYFFVRATQDSNGGGSSITFITVGFTRASQATGNQRQGVGEGLYFCLLLLLLPF